MIKPLQAIRGMNDVLPDDIAVWQHVELQLAQCANSFGYQEIRFPLVEKTQLFKRSIGEVTDIVEKEMYTFDDLNGDSLSLRPEGTAGCTRACLENGLLHNQSQKIWYLGPMFRHEKPQKGRYRQFMQFGLESFGIDGLAIELELLQLCQNLWRRVGVSKVMQLEINSIGTLQERQTHRQALVDYFSLHFDELDEECKRRLHTNPLRILDSKNQSLQAIIQQAPKLNAFFSEESHARFEALCHGLDSLKIPYRINPYLVRGLDYYCHTVFEWTTDQLGAQATVCAGGRYNGLVEQIGGRATPAIGFALGVERLLLLARASLLETMPKETSLYIISMGEGAQISALSLAESIRQACPRLTVQTNCQTGASYKSQFKKADKSGAELALILGEDEISSNTVGVKWLRKDVPQQRVSFDELINLLTSNWV